MRWIIAPATIAIAAIALPLAAAENCGSHATIKRNLFVKYGEVRQGGRIPNSKSLHELYANTKTGTWTTLRLRADGSACVTGFGDGWRRPAGHIEGDPT